MQTENVKSMDEDDILLFENNDLFNGPSKRQMQMVTRYVQKESALENSSWHPVGIAQMLVSFPMFQKRTKQVLSLKICVF